MRICYIFSNLHLSEITAEPKMAHRLAEFALFQGHQIYVISNHLKERREIKKNIQYFLLKGLGDIKTYLFKTTKILRYLNDIDADILHAQGGLIIVYAWLLNLSLRKPLFFSLFESFDTFNGLRKKLLLFCISRTNKTFVISEYFKKQLLANGIKSSKVFVARIGLESKFLEKYQQRKSNWEVFFFGDSSKDRGFDILYELAKKMPDISFKILLRWKKDCKKELAAAKKLPNIQFVSISQRQSLVQMLNRSKIILLPFRFMGVRPPLSIIETMALGKCVITSDMAGNEEIIQNNKNGLLLNFNNLNETVQVLKNLLNNPRRILDLGSAASKSIRLAYSNDEYIKIINTYAKAKTQKTI